MQYLLLFFILVITGCASYEILPPPSLNALNNTTCLVDGNTYTYSISVMSVYDLEGVADSYFKVTCPTGLTFMNYKIDGRQDVDIHKKEPAPPTNPLTQEVCCLPF